MIGETLDILSYLITVYGLPALFVIFFIEGILLGKVIPPIVLIPSALLVFGEGMIIYGILLFICALGSTAGQYSLYHLIDKHGIGFVHETKFIPLSEDRVEQSMEWFDKWGNLSVTVGNSLPLVRGVMTIPAALSPNGRRTFPLYAFVGNTMYHGTIILFSIGLLSFLPLELIF